VCGHQSHGQRVARSKPFRTVAFGCLVDGCSCEKFVESSAQNSATMSPDFQRALNNLRREFNEKLDRLKAEYLKQ
jgi:hypothetical protein